MEEERSEARITLPDGVIAQHRHLADAMARLQLARENGRSWEDLARLLDDLLADVERHFAAEERAMVHGAYPRLAEHRRAHRVFLRRLKALRAECDAQATELMPVLSELLQSWFREHEATLDQHAIGFLGLVD